MNKWNYDCIFSKQMSRLLPLDFTRLLFLFASAILLTFILSDHVATAELLFQSPASPAAQPVLQEAAPAQPAPAEQAPAQPTPTEQPSTQPAPAEQSAPAQSPGSVDQASDQTQPTSSAPEAAAPVSPIPEATEEESTLEVPSLPEPERVERSDRFSDEEAEEDDSANLVLDRAELVDTIVVSTAYVWLCCGIMLFLLIPLVFLFLQIRGRTKIREEYS
jgi:hypothetical protein